MAEFYLVKIGSVFLTKTGLETGRACLLTVSGAANLLVPFSGNIQNAVDGTPIMQRFATGTKGKLLEIKVDVLTVAVWASLVALINTALSSGASVNLTGTGDIGNFDLDCLPLLPTPYEAAEFTDGRIQNATFRFVASE